MTEERLKLTLIKLLKTNPQGRLDIEHTVIQLVERMNLIINLFYEYSRQTRERREAFLEVMENFREVCGVEAVPPQGPGP